MAGNGFQVFDDLDALSRAAAEFFITRMRQSIARHGMFSVALAGGSTPQKLYELLAQAPMANRIDWQRVWVFFGDERAVPPDHPDSNFRMAHEALLEHVDIPKAQVFRMCGEWEDASAAARDYADNLEELPLSLGGVPELDLVILGLGDDGHTASLFPDTDILSNMQDWVAAVYVDKFNSWRISLTLPMLNNARELLFLVAGETKAEIIRRVHNGPTGERRYPVQMIDPRGTVHWFIDRKAATRLR
jgi:6-phosphogluconolactonase